MLDKIGVFLLKFCVMVLAILALLIFYSHHSYGYKIVKDEIPQVIRLPVGQKLIGVKFREDGIGLIPLTRKLKIGEEPTVQEVTVSKYTSPTNSNVVYIEE